MAQTYETDGGRQERYRPMFNGGSQATAPGSTEVKDATGTATDASGSAGAGVALPNEGIYQEKQILANKAYLESMAGLNASKLGIARQYGFQDDGSVDPNNTLGLYQQNRRNSAMELDAAQESALGRGLGHGGLGAQIAEAPKYGEEVSASNLMQQYLQAIAGNLGDQRNAATTRDSALLDARNQQIQDAMMNNWFTPAATGDAPPTDPPPTDGTTPPATTTTTKKPGAPKQNLDAQRALLARSLALNAKYGLGKKTTTYGGRH